MLVRVPTWLAASASHRCRKSRWRSSPPRWACDRTSGTSGTSESCPTFDLVGKIVEPIRLNLRESRYSIHRLARPRIAVLPADSGPRANYPSQASWLRILAALAERFADAEFVIVGKARRPPDP
jgi:hypothetical protein